MKGKALLITGLTEIHTFIFPVISKQEYLKSYLGGLVGKYFNGSFTGLATFFAKENNISLEELSEIMEEVKNELKDTEQ